MIQPHGRLTWYPCTADGHVTQFGQLLTWRADKTWSRRHVEFIEPLGALAPVGRQTPQAMSLSAWAPIGNWNDSWRVVTLSGNPATSWLEWYDGAVYASDAEFTEYQGMLQTTAEWAPRVALHTLRFAPPEGQACPIGCYLSFPCERKQGGVWVTGWCSLWLPQQNEKYHGAILHSLAPLPSAGQIVDILDFTVPGNEILSQGHSGGALQQGVARDTWLVEYEELWQDANGGLYGEAGTGRTFQRSWLLIRNASDLSQWWVYQSDALRLVTGKLRLSAFGAVQAFNVAPIRYGALIGYAWPQGYNVLPVVTGSTWNSTVVWDGIENPVSGWTLTTAGMIDGTLRPLVTMAADAEANKRALWWYGQEWHAAVIGDAGEGSTTSDTLQHLKRIEVKLSRDYKGATGSVEFYPFEGEPPTDLVENAKVALEVGWDAAAGAGLTLTRVATQYVEPGSLSYVRDGDEQGGAVQLRFSTADFWSVRVARKQVLDYGQAGGNLLSSWAAHVCGRLGLDPATQLTVDTDVASRVLPFAEIPSLPSLDARDGDEWQGHLQAVERAANIRIGFDYAGTGGMFVDDGPPEYVAGTSSIAYTLDYDSMTAKDVVYVVEYQLTGDAHRNCAKFVIGRDNLRRSLYVAQTTAARAAGIGDDWWQVIVDEDASSFAGLLNTWDWRRLGWRELLVWEGPLRPALRPDQFVQVSHLPDMNVVSSIFQIVEHTMIVDSEANEATSRIVAVPARIANPDTSFALMGAMDETTGDVAVTEYAMGGLLE